MSEQDNFFDLPDGAVSSTKQSGQRKVDPTIYDPDPKAHNGSYKSVIRFVPYLKEKDKSKLTKYTAKFFNPLTKESLFVDCPSNVGKNSILWTVDSVINGLKKEEPTLHEELKKNFSRWYTNYSPVYIKKDPQRPDLEGKVLLFKFRHQIDTLITQQMNPEEVDGMATSRKVNPYHLLEGKDFLCVVGMKTQVFKDWTKCKFMEDVTPFIFKSGDETVQVQNDAESIKVVSEFLLTNTPSMDPHKHQEWTEETYEKVAESILSCIPQPQLIDLILAKSKDEKMNEILKSKRSPSKTSTYRPAVAEEEVDFKSSTPVDATTPSEKSSEYDALFDNL